MMVRPATGDDTERLAELWNAFNAESTYIPYPPARFDPAFLATNTVLVADEDGSLVGTLYLNSGNEGFGYVFGVYVVPDARRRGIAEALMRAAARVLHDQGRSYLVLGVDTPNEAARALYAKLGFVDQARTLRADVGDLI